MTSVAGFGITDLRMNRANPTMLQNEKPPHSKQDTGFGGHAKSRPDLGGWGGGWVLQRSGEMQHTRTLVMFSLEGVAGPMSKKER